MRHVFVVLGLALALPVQQGCVFYETFRSVDADGQPDQGTQPPPTRDAGQDASVVDMAPDADMAPPVDPCMRCTGSQFCVVTAQGRDCVGKRLDQLEQAECVRTVPALRGPSERAVFSAAQTGARPVVAALQGSEPMPELDFYPLRAPFDGNMDVDAPSDVTFEGDLQLHGVSPICGNLSAQSCNSPETHVLLVATADFAGAPDRLIVQLRRSQGSPAFDDSSLVAEYKPAMAADRIALCEASVTPGSPLALRAAVLYGGGGDRAAHLALAGCFADNNARELRLYELNNTDGALELEDAITRDLDGTGAEDAASAIDGLSLRGEFLTAMVRRGELSTTSFAVPLRLGGDSLQPIDLNTTMFSLSDPVAKDCQGMGNVRVEPRALVVHRGDDNQFIHSGQLVDNGAPTGDYIATQRRTTNTPIVSLRCLPPGHTIVSLAQQGTEPMIGDSPKVAAIVTWPRPDEADYGIGEYFSGTSNDEDPGLLKPFPRVEGSALELEGVVFHGPEQTPRYSVVAWRDAAPAQREASSIVVARMADAETFYCGAW